jgi:chemotaxis protein CheD
MKLSTQPGDVIITHALGSCLGLAVHDPVHGVGGMLHVMMPLSQTNPEKAKANPFMFVDTGVPTFFRSLYKAGAEKAKLIVKVAGGANIHGSTTDRFAIGKKNYIMLKKMLWKNEVMIESEEIGGGDARTMHLEIGSGRVWLSTGGRVRDL